MCINKETSLIAFLIGFSLSSYILYRGIQTGNKKDFIIGIMFISVSLMQLLEYFIWTNQKCSFKNSIYSILIMLLLLIQIIFFYTSINIKFKVTNIIHIGFICSIIVFSYAIYILIKNKDKLCSRPSKNSCRLEWAGMKYLYNNNIFVTCLATFLYLFMLYKLQKYIVIKHIISENIILFLLLISILYSVIKEKINFFNIFGSIWCFLAVFYPIIYLLKI